MFYDNNNLVYNFGCMIQVLEFAVPMISARALALDFTIFRLHLQRRAIATKVAMLMEECVLFKLARIERTQHTKHTLKFTVCANNANFQLKLPCVSVCLCASSVCIICALELLCYKS